MKQKMTVLISILICATLFLGLTGIVSASESQVITVTGTGKVTLTPDIVRITIGVDNENENISELIDTSSKKVEAIRKTLMDSGIDKSDIKTTNYSLYGYKKWDAKLNVSTDVYVYSLNNSYQVTVRNIEKINEVLDKCISNGATSINGIEYDSSERESAYDTARTAAVNDAADKANKIARTLGLKIIDIDAITMEDPYQQLYQTSGYGVGMGGGGGTPAIETGNMDISVTITIRYIFERVGLG